MARVPLSHLAAAAAICAAPAIARPQYAPYLERRLIEIHSLLLDLPPAQAPGALGPGSLDLSLELVAIPSIDGDVGAKRELTASDHMRLYPRPRLALGLPAPLGLRAFAGVSFIPPVEVRRVSVGYGAAEAGVATARGPLSAGVRVHGVYAVARSPVTDPATRDVLHSRLLGADASVGLHLGGGALALEPYVGAGATSLLGRFRVTADGTVLRSRYTSAVLLAGVRLHAGLLQAVVEGVDYPGRLAHLDLRLGLLLGP